MREKELSKIMKSMEDNLVLDQAKELSENMDIDVEAIRIKAIDKLSSKQASHKKRHRGKVTLAFAACITLMLATTVFADQIKIAVQSYMGNSIIKSTVVPGDAYVLPTEQELDDNIVLKSMYIWKDTIEMECESSLSLGELGDIRIQPEKSDVVYEASGYSHDGRNTYFFIFKNWTLDNYKVEPFGKFLLEIQGKEYGIQLDGSSQIIDKSAETFLTEEEEISEATLDAFLSDESGEKRLYIIPNLKENLTLIALGRQPVSIISKNETHYLKDEIITVSNGLRLEGIQGKDQQGNIFDLKALPKVNGHVSTVYELPDDAIRLDKVVVESLLVRDNETSVKVILPLPQDKSVELNEELVFGDYIIVLESIQKLSDGKFLVSMDLSTNEERTKQIVGMNYHSEQATSIKANIENDRASVVITVDENSVDEIQLELSNSVQLINGNWSLDIKDK